jgi:membrane-associated phospholipid phosphatase
MTRIVLLAHWFTDVVVGLALAAGVERGLRLRTKPPLSEPLTITNDEFLWRSYICLF